MFVAGASEAAVASVGIFEGIGDEPLDFFVLGDDHLAEAFAWFDGEWLVGEVDDDDFDFATVVAVDGCRCVGYGEAFPEGQAATGSYLGLKTIREGDV